MAGLSEKDMHRSLHGVSWLAIQHCCPYQGFMLILARAEHRPFEGNDDHDDYLRLQSGSGPHGAGNCTDVQRHEVRSKKECRYCT